jgi:peptidyl-prolyl cis-trans isomerase B (cyclophilin B)
MGTTKRERQRANRQSKLVAAQEAHRKAQSRRRVLRFGGLIVAFLVIAYLISVFAGDGDDDGQSTDTPATVAVTAPPAGASVTGDTPCPPADGSAERTTTFEKAPPTCIDAAKTYTAAITTSLGGFTVALDPTVAPQAVNNFVVLSRYHYYDGLPFHRIVTDFVAQVGDANPRDGQLGTGGPGYTFADELPAAGGDAYVPGIVAMANSGPDSNGSQFFVFVGPNNPFVSNPAYTIFGNVTEGMDTTIPAIMAAGTTSEEGGVTQEITIQSIVITEA